MLIAKSLAAGMFLSGLNVFSISRTTDGAVES